MATEGSVYQRGKDGRWVAQYRDASGKVRYLYRKTKAEAKQALREALTDRDNGIIPASKMTVEIYLVHARPNRDIDAAGTRPLPLVNTWHTKPQNPLISRTFSR
jgi:hypothetical protein